MGIPTLNPLNLSGTWEQAKGGLSQTLADIQTAIALLAKIEQPWDTRVFSQNDFTASQQMTWTVGAPVTDKFHLISSSELSWVVIISGVVGGVADFELRVKIPGSFTPINREQESCIVIPNGVGQIGSVGIHPGVPYVSVFTDPTTTTAWTVGQVRWKFCPYSILQREMNYGRTS